MREVGPKNTILVIYFRHPYVLDKASGLPDAGAIVASFGVSRLPFSLANNLEAIGKKHPDKAGCPKADTLFGLGFGLSYYRKSGPARFGFAAAPGP